MDLKFDDETIAIMLHKARVKIAIDKTMYKCRNPRYCNMSYEQWKEWKKKIKKKKSGDVNE